MHFAFKKKRRNLIPAALLSDAVVVSHDSFVESRFQQQLVVVIIIFFLVSTIGSVFIFNWRIQRWSAWTANDSRLMKIAVVIGTRGRRGGRLSAVG